MWKQISAEPYGNQVDTITNREEDSLTGPKKKLFRIGLADFGLIILLGSICQTTFFLIMAR
jgi:hypothetical protein